MGLTPGRNAREEGPFFVCPLAHGEDFARALVAAVSKLHLGSLTHPILSLPSHVFAFYFYNPKPFFMAFHLSGKKCAHILRLAQEATESQQM